MAGNRIRGITVEIGGDTTKLQTVDILVSRALPQLSVLALLA